MTSSVRPEISDTEDGEGFYDAHHIGLLHLIHEAKEQEKAGKDAGEGPRQILKAYLEEKRLAGDEPVIFDEERGLKAFLQERSGWEWDLRGCPEETLKALCAAGFLKVDNAAFDATRKVAPGTMFDIAARFRRQITGSVALFVEKVK